MILSRGPEVGLTDLPAQIGQPANRKVEVGSAITLEGWRLEHIRRVLAVGPLAGRGGPHPGH